MKGYIEERAVEAANYIIDTRATVRQTADRMGISKQRYNGETYKDQTDAGGSGEGRAGCK